MKENNNPAYFVGVGYGKKLAGDKNVGFNSRQELEQFEHGITQKDKHFNSYRAEPLTFWERLFGKKPKKTIKYKDKKQHNKNVHQRAKRIKRARKNASLKSKKSKKR